MPFCSVCDKDQFLIYKSYQGKKLHPRRCIGCIVRLPAEGFELSEPRTNGNTRYHGWSLIDQRKNTDVWYCPYCKITLISPKLGIPNSQGCLNGSKFRFRMGFWASLKLKKPILCPLCDMNAEIMAITRIIKKRPGKSFWPFTCSECFDV